MILRACIASVALALVAGCKVKDEEVRTVEPVEIAPGTGDERPYVPGDYAEDELTDYPNWWDDERPADRRAERATERDRDDRAARDRTLVRVASRQDLRRAIEDADRRIERVRTTQSLGDAQEADLDVLERRLREVRQDLDDQKDEAGVDWAATSEQIRYRLRRINRAIERVEEHDA